MTEPRRGVNRPVNPRMYAAFLLVLGAVVILFVIVHENRSLLGHHQKPVIKIVPTPLPTVTMTAHPHRSAHPRPAATTTNKILVSSEPSAHPTATVTTTRPVMVRTTKTAKPKPTRHPTSKPSPTPDPVASCLKNLLNLKSCHR